MKMNFSSFTSWKIGDFILQLLVVILGIVITFAASNAVNKHAKAKETAKAMEIVKDELKQNLEDFDHIAERLKLEQRICQYIRHYENHLEDASPDTLQKYVSMPFQSFNFTYSVNAMEMLKASSLIPNVRNKELILSVMKAYDSLKSISEHIKWYYNTKEEHGKPLNSDDKFTREYEVLFSKEFSKNIHKVIAYQLSSLPVHNIIVFGATGVNFEKVLQNTRNNITQAIEMIQQEYNLQ